MNFLKKNYSLSTFTKPCTSFDGGLTFDVSKTTLIKTLNILIFLFFVGITSLVAQTFTFDFNFNDGVPGEQVTEFSDASGNTYYNTAVVYDGANSAQMNIQQGADGWGVWGGRKSFPYQLGEGDDLWIRLRTFFPTDFDFNTNLDFLKFLRVAVKQGDGTHIGYHDLMIRNDLSYYHANELGNTAVRMQVFENEYEYAQNMIVGETIIGGTSGASAIITGLKPTGYNFDYNSGSSSFVAYETITGQTSGENRTRMRYIRTDNNTFFGADYPIQTNVWETIVYRLKFSTTEPLLQFYKHVNATGFDGNNKPIGGSMQLIYEDAIDKTLKSPTDNARAMLIFTYWNGGAPQTQNMHIDDLWISTNPPPEMSTLSVEDNELLSNTVSIIPNPTNNIFTINLKNETLKKVIIYNSLGQQVKEVAINEVDISNLSNGIYFVKITSQSGKTVTKKIIIK